LKTIYDDNKIVERLEKIFPDKLPRKMLSEYEQGVLVGIQKCIEEIKEIIEEDNNG